MTSIYKQCLDAIQSDIQGLGLSGITTNDIKVVKFPRYDRTMTAPGIFIYPQPETIPGSGTNDKDDVGYRVAVTMYQASNSDLTSDMDRILTWRQSIRRHFINQRPFLATVSEVWQCYIEPAAVFDPAAFTQQFDASHLLIRCVAREGRT